MPTLRPTPGLLLRRSHHSGRVGAAGFDPGSVRLVKATGRWFHPSTGQGPIRETHCQAGAMNQRKDLAGTLERASDWVRTEFASLEEFTIGLGCEHDLEGGPGVAIRLAGRTIGHAHPKLGHIGIGLPDAMRTDVEALTGALRPQQGNAWFNFGPGVADRDTVERLLSLSVDAVSISGDAPAGPRTGRRPRLDDEQDLRLVLGVLRAFRDHEQSTGSPSSVRPIRETLFARWEGPRLPVGGKYSPQLPHSPAAREQRRLTGGTSGLVFEHVAPISGVIRGFLRNLPADEDSLRRALDATSDRVVITRTEDAALTAAGYRTEVPEPSDPWSKYRSALDLDKSDFVSFAEDDDSR